MGKKTGDFSVSIKKRGRPKKLIPNKSPEDVAFILAKYGATQDEIARELDIDTDTLRNHTELYENWKIGVGQIKVHLRRVQMEKALAGNVPMLIWLGKQMLGQRDKQEVAMEDGAALKLILENADDLRRKLEAMESEPIDISAREVEQ